MNSLQHNQYVASSKADKLKELFYNARFNIHSKTKTTVSIKKGSN